MYLERLLQINMATLAALGALLLGMGQRSEGPPLLVMLAAALSVWLTDVTGKFRLGRWTANVLMLVGAVFSLRDVYPPRSDIQTIGLSWFLIYLQIILLFQEKDQWKYWLLIMLSLLEVVVATLFSQGAGFGVLLVIYMLLGFSAMTLLMLYRQWEYFRLGKGAGRPWEWDWPWTGLFVSAKSRRGGPATAQGGKLLDSALLQNENTPRWRLAAERPEFTSLPAGSSHAGLGRDLVGRLGRMGLLTMALTLVLFFAVPRFEQAAAWRNPIAQPQTQPLVGFTDKVKLGELGNIIESRETVLRVQFFQGQKDTTPLQLNGDVYLQGAYLMTYEHGQWAGHDASCDWPGTAPLARERPLPWNDVVRQKFKLEGLDRPELFYVAPYIAIDEAYPEISIDLASQRILRSEHWRTREFNYTLATTAILEGNQLPLMPVAWNDLPNTIREIPTKDLPQLIAMATKWIKESGLPASDRAGRARYLEHKLATSPQFQYSLTGVDRNPDIDPIEDFLSEHPQGHCEYFATALTLMLRSQGIQARMVSGFKVDSDAWNPAGGYYQVRQLHAHTWVEARLRPEHITGELKHAENYWSRGGGARSWAQGAWLRLDPTPGGAVGEHTSWLKPIRDGFDLLEGAWSRYVVEFDCKTQRDAIYQPLAAVVKNLWRIVIRIPLWQAFDSVAVALYLDHLNQETKWLLLGMIGIVLLVLVAGIGLLLFRMGPRLWARWTGNHSRRPERRRAEIAFYRRFEHLMARQGLVRAPAQTQREFAAAVGVHFAALTGDSRLATLPATVADAFYCVRFGQAPLDNLQTQTVEQALAEIAAIRKNTASGNPRPPVAGA